MAFEDKTITCVECGSDFVFTAVEQEFYAEKGFRNEPRRCMACRRNRRQGMVTDRGREMFVVSCATCGKDAQVPFKPTGVRPVYCDDCFRAQRKA